MVWIFCNNEWEIILWFPVRPKIALWNFENFEFWVLHSSNAISRTVSKLLFCRNICVLAQNYFEFKRLPPEWNFIESKFYASKKYPDFGWKFSVFWKNAKKWRNYPKTCQDNRNTRSILKQIIPFSHIDHNHTLKNISLHVSFQKRTVASVHNRNDISGTPKKVEIVWMVLVAFKMDLAISRKSDNSPLKWHS